MRVVPSLRARLREECGQLFGFPGILTLCSLYEGTRREEELYVERSAQGPVQGDPEGPD